MHDFINFMLLEHPVQHDTMLLDSDIYVYRRKATQLSPPWPTKTYCMGPCAGEIVKLLKQVQ